MAWGIKDIDGNVLNTFSGDKSDRYVGTMWKGVMVYSAEQIDLPAPPVILNTQTEILTSQVQELLTQVSELRTEVESMR